MASNAYRQNYKRKWIAAKIVINHSNCATGSRINISPKKLARRNEITPTRLHNPFHSVFQIDEDTSTGNSTDCPDDVHHISNDFILSGESSSEDDNNRHLSDLDIICL